MPVLKNRLGDRPARQRNTGRSTAGPSSEARRETQNELPPYEPPLYPLSAAAKRELVEISTKIDTRRYEKHIQESINHLGKSVAGVNDSLRSRQTDLERAAAKRVKTGSQEKNFDEEELEQYCTDLEKNVVPLTERTEKALRELIDRQAEIVDEKAAMADVISHFQNQHPARQPQPRQRRRHRQDQDEEQSNEEEGEDAKMEDVDEPQAPEKGVVDMLKEAQQQKATQYEAMDAHQRYGLNNDYAAFKKLWHDALNGDEEVPLPEARRWFDSDGNPVMSATGMSRGDDQDEDEDLVITDETVSYTCPLSLRELEEPFSNNQCKHTFEKSVIEEYIRANGPKVRCPQTGCAKEFMLKDFHLDTLMLRKMERAKRAKEAEEMDSDEDDGDAAQRSRIVKGERGQGRRTQKRVVEEIEDE